jgi:hypothetical protein
MTRRWLLAVAVIVLAVVVGLLVGFRDPYRGLGFDPSVKRPTFVDGGPTLLVDQAHHNHHSLSSTFRPFADLLRNDGFQVEALREPVTRAALDRARIFAVVTALADTETNAEPAFAEAEIEAIIDWVMDGGSLLLVTEHYPFANSVEPLANALGFEVAKGMTFDAAHHRTSTGDDSRLLFSRANGLMADHPITDGRGGTEAVRLVETFTGDAIRPMAGRRAEPLLSLGQGAVNRLGTPRIKRSGGDVIVEVEFGPPRPVAGWLQGAAASYGRGRIVLLAEAAMITAQVDGGRPLGMNAPGNDNRQFLLNMMRWLAREF